MVTQAGSPKRPEVFGPYRVVRELGRGGMGVVYLAEHEELGRRVALKVLSSRFAAGESAFARFEREIRVVARLQHPRIVPVYEVGRIEGAPYFTMEYVDGATLHELLDALRDSSVPLGELQPWHLRPSLPDAVEVGSSAWPKSYFEAVCRVVVQIADALQYAHDHGVIHRDVKPSNVLIARDGRALLFDFGLAKVDADQDLTLSGEFVGTPHYVSPEQAEGSGEPLDGRTDVFSLGVTLYELLGLQLPFHGRTASEVFRQIASVEPPPPRRINSAVPRDLETICLTALEKDRARRYGSPAEMALDLRRFLEFKPVLARPASRVTRTLRWVRRHRVAATLVVLGMGLLLALAAFGWQYQVNRVVAGQRLRAQRANALAQLTSAQLLAQRGAWPQALRAYDEADRYGLADPLQLAIGRIEALEGAGELDHAAAELSRLRAGGELGRGRAELLLLEGDLGIHRRLHPDGALDLVRRALVIGGDGALGPADRAYAQALLADDLTDVRRYLEQTLALHPFHRRAHESLALVLLSLGHLDDAMDAAERMASLYRGDPYPLLIEVMVLASRGDLLRAGQRLEQVRALLPGHDTDLDRWAQELALSVRPQQQLLDQLSGGSAAPDRSGQLASSLLQAPARILPGVASATDPERYVVEFRMPPALARSYLPLARLRWQSDRAQAVTALYLREVERVLTESLAYHRDGFRFFLRGLYRYFLAHVLSTGSGLELRQAEDDFTAAWAAPSMIEIGKAAVFYTLEVQREQRRQTGSAAAGLPERARWALRTAAELDGLAPERFRYLVQAAVEFGEVELAEEVALRWQRTHGGAGPLVARAGLALRRGDPRRALELAEQVLAEQPDHAMALACRRMARAALDSSGAGEGRGR